MGVGSSQTPRSVAEKELEAAIDTRRARCAVIGLGYIGSAVACALLDAGFEVLGYDRSHEAVARFETGAGVERSAGMSASTRDDILAGAEVVHVAVSIPCDRSRAPDLDALRAAAASVRRHAAPTRLVILHSTVPPGTTRWFAAECSDDSDGNVTFVAHCPERLQPGNPAWTIATTPHVVAGVDSASCRLAAQTLHHLSEDPLTASAPEVTELAKLMENAFIAVGVALAGEVAELAHAVGVSGTEVAEAAASKPFAYHGFFPGPGVGGHCIPNDLAMLAELRARLALDAPVLTATDRSLGRLPALTVGRLRAVMTGRGRELSGGSILLVGLGYKPGSSDLTNTAAREVVRLLRDLGATPFYVDSGVHEFEVDGMAVERVTVESFGGSRFAAALVLAGDRELAPESLLLATDIVVDAGGGRGMGPLPGAVDHL
jgi:UDP-N-acetyl-D-glucosamine dehydrogenase